MASTLTTRNPSEIRDIPLSALADPAPTRIKAREYGLGREPWASTPSIWQTGPKMFDFTKEVKQTVLPAKNDKLVKADVSDAVAVASTTRYCKHSPSASNGQHIATSSTILSGRSMGSVASPTRLRNNGTFSTDAEAMTTIGQSALFSGSAPDLDHNNASSAFKNHKGSTIGRNFRQFNVEDAEEFVPSNLRDFDSRLDWMYDSVRDAPCLAPKKPEFMIPRDASDINFDFPSIQSSGQSQYGLFQSNLSSVVPGPGLSLDSIPTRHLLHTNGNFLRGSGRLSGMPAANGTWVDPQNVDDSTVRNGVLSSRLQSSLRPDVAAYQPSRYAGQVRAYDSQRDSQRTCDVALSPRTGGGDRYSNSTNQQATLMNSLAFNANYSSGAEYPNSNHHDNQQRHRSLLPEPTRFPMTDHRQRNFGSDTQYSDLEGTLSTTRPKVPTHNDIFRHNTQAIANPYHNTQYQFTATVPRTTPYQQPYNVDPMNGAIDFQQDGTYSQGVGSERRSEVLEDYRTNSKNRKYELKDIYGYIVEFSGDQSGSRFIQGKLETANSDEKDQVFSELLTDARQLMSDVFGNYVIQKMFEHGSQTQKKILAGHMQGNMYKLSTQAYGCRCVQKAFEHILTDQQAALVKELDGHVMFMVDNQHGNHVIQKAIECIPGEHIQFIVDAHKNQVVRMAKHSYGCRIIQRMLEHCLPHAKRAILDELHCAIPQLIDDQYGNYVIQCMIKKCSMADKHRVIEFVLREVLFYSTHKFASNVVEKAIDSAEGAQRAELFRKLTGPDPSNGMQSPVLSLLKDQYGNYVIQTVLKTIDQPAKTVLAEQVHNYLAFIGKTSRGKQISAMADTLNEVGAGHSPGSTSPGLQTPCTPTSLNPGGSVGTPMVKPINMTSPDHLARDGERGVLSLKVMHS